MDIIGPLQTNYHQDFRAKVAGSSIPRSSNLPRCVCVCYSLPSSVPLSVCPSPQEEDAPMQVEEATEEVRNGHGCLQESGVYR